MFELNIQNTSYEQEFVDIIYLRMVYKKCVCTV